MGKINALNIAYGANVKTIKRIKKKKEYTEHFFGKLTFQKRHLGILLVFFLKAVMKMEQTSSYTIQRQQLMMCHHELFSHVCALTRQQKMSLGE